MMPSGCERKRRARMRQANIILALDSKEKGSTQRSQRTRRGITMRLTAKFGAILVASTLATAGNARAQEMRMPQQEEHQHMGIAPVKPEYPRMGKAQEHAQGARVTLEQAQKIASESNPTLRQAEAEIRAARARQQQSGLYPNPTAGYTGDEIRGGSVGGGKQGFFLQQAIVTGGKLGLSRDVFEKEVKLA